MKDKPHPGFDAWLDRQTFKDQVPREILFATWMAGIHYACDVWDRVLENQKVFDVAPAPTPAAVEYPLRLARD
jgi:hypothetical protein